METTSIRDDGSWIRKKNLRRRERNKRRRKSL